MKIVEVSPSNLFLGGYGGWGGWGGWGGPIFFLEENLACQVIRMNHTKFQPSSSKRLEKIPCLKLETDDRRHNTRHDRRHPRLKNYSPRRNLNSVVDKKSKKFQTPKKIRVGLDLPTVHLSLSLKVLYLFREFRNLEVATRSAWD